MEKLSVNEHMSTVNLDSVESEANFEGNDTEVLVSRLKNPTIKKQIVEILYRKTADYLHDLKNKSWETYIPDEPTSAGHPRLLREKKSGEIINEEKLEIMLEYAPKLQSIEEVESELDAQIAEINSVTEIDYTQDEPKASVIPLNWIVPWTNEKPTQKQMSIIEAHEKGHRIRDYNHLTEKWRKAFDLSKVEFTQEYYSLLKKNIENHTNKPGYLEEEATLDEVREDYLNKYLFTGMEIAERLSQLKNYFGFKGDEKFTKEHLHYAKEHYVSDTNMDNGMTFFFEAITPETEGDFLEIINNSGI